MNTPTVLTFASERYVIFVRAAVRGGLGFTFMGPRYRENAGYRTGVRSFFNRPVLVFFTYPCAITPIPVPTFEIELSNVVLVFLRTPCAITPIRATKAPLSPPCDTGNSDA